MKKILLISSFFITAFGAFAQQDSVIVTSDSVVIEAQDTMLIKSYAKRFNPRKALLYAAVVPGLGQVYNKKYWKLPLVYGGFFLLGREIGRFNDIYKTYKVHLFYNLENGLSTGTGVNPNINLTTTQLRRIVDRSRRERDFFVILTGGMYLLQMIDAHVDAHLKEFDLNPNLKVSIEPTITQDALTGRQTGASLIFRF